MTRAAFPDAKGTPMSAARDFLFRLRRAEDLSRPPHAWLGALGGIALLVLSAVFILGGLELGVGTTRRLGTGAFPVITGVVLAMLAVAIVIVDLREAGDAEKPDWLVFAAIGAALMVFACSVERAGLVPGVFLTVVIASLPDPSLRWRGKLTLGAIVALGSWGLFIGALGLPFDAFKGF